MKINKNLFDIFRITKMFETKAKLYYCKKKMKNWRKELWKKEENDFWKWKFWKSLSFCVMCSLVSEDKSTRYLTVQHCRMKSSRILKVSKNQFGSFFLFYFLICNCVCIDAGLVWCTSEYLILRCSVVFHPRKASTNLQLYFIREKHQRIFNCFSSYEYPVIFLSKKYQWIFRCNWCKKSINV